MLSARAYSFRQKSKLATSLSWIGGYTNTITLLACGWVSSHMTGPTTWLGRVLVEGTGKAGDSIRTVFFFGLVIVLFWIGAVTSAVLTESAERSARAHKYLLPMIIEVVLLMVFAVSLFLYNKSRIQTSNLQFYTLGVACVAMGLQNATITRISGAVVRTTHITGVITDLGLEAVQYFYWFRDRTRSGDRLRRSRLLRISRRNLGALRLLLLASIFGSFLLGAVMATVMFDSVPRYAMLLPILFLWFIIGVEYFHPISELHELDRMSDPDLKLYGIVHSMLPANLGMYRMRPQSESTRAPDFQAWAEHLPVQLKSVIMAMSPQVKLNENALLNLENAISYLENRRINLVVSDISQKQFEQLLDRGIVDRLGVENVCVDIEFAVARAMDNLRLKGLGK